MGIDGFSEELAIQAIITACVAGHFWYTWMFVPCRSGVRDRPGTPKIGQCLDQGLLMVRRLQVNKVSKRRAKAKVRTKKKDPIFVDGQRPRPMYVDYKDVELLKKLTNRQGKIISRRKSGCTAVSQHAVTKAIKRARFMALLPYTGE